MLRRVSSWIGFALLLFLTTTPGSAECVLPEMRTDERPDPPGVATEILASFAVIDLMSVDDARQQLDLDLTAKLSWRDPRLAGLDGCRFSINDVWFPRLTLFNSSNLRTNLTNDRAQVTIGEGGEVTYANRFTGFVSSYHNLSLFPFDEHDFRISVGSLEDDIDSLQFVADSHNTWIAERLNIEGWTVGRVYLSSRPMLLRNADKEVSMLTLTISAARDPDYYMYRMMLLLVFVVAISWAIFWVPPRRFEFQIGLGATSMLTAIAFSLGISEQLPRLGYLTVLDKWLIWAIFLIFLSIVEALVAGLMVLSGREAGALRLDNASRVVFPLLLFGGWAVFFMTAG